MIDQPDESTKSISHLLSAELEKGEVKRKKKRRSRGGGADGDAGGEEEAEEALQQQQAAAYALALANEPVYCLCKKISYGQMVGCDNADCLIEWFHYGCVGLTKDVSTVLAIPRVCSCITLVCFTYELWCL